MAAKGGQPGNTNSEKGRKWRDAINKALAQDKGALERVAKKLIAKAEEGDVSAIKEFGDRIDGKVVQGIEGADGGPLVIQVVKFADDSNPG